MDDFYAARSGTIPPLPWTNSAPPFSGEVVQVMKKLAEEGMTMLVVSHEMGFASAAADEVIFMEGGVIVEQGPPSEILTAPQHPRTAQFLSMINETH